MANMFGTPEKPVIKPPPPMPDPNNPSLLEDRRKLAGERAAGGGRRSTMLTDALKSGAEYGAVKLGSGAA